MQIIPYYPISRLLIAHLRCCASLMYHNFADFHYSRTVLRTMCHAWSCGLKFLGTGKPSTTACLGHSNYAAPCFPISQGSWAGFWAD